MVLTELRNTLLIGLTVLGLGMAAWWLDPQSSEAQQHMDGREAPVESELPEIDDPEHPDRQVPALRSASTQPVAARPPSLHFLLGINDARARLGKAIPTGEGITVGHVELNLGGYMPDTRSPQFNGVTFVERSGPSKVSGHANSTARVIYGLTGLAPGVSVVHCYGSRDWMSLGYLNAGTPHPPTGGPMRVLTHSWVSDAPNAIDVLRRIDWQVDMHDTVVCAGVNNGSQTPVPYLLGTAYNVIAVGTAQANGSSGRYTRIETRGRCKPDIVGPRGLTSFTTPAVAACAARLLQAADEMTEHAHRAGRAEVIKAVLLCGAIKPDGWQPKPGRPLDEHLGAGVVHFDNSLQILQSGPADPGRLPRRMGWDFNEILPDQTHVYEFQTQAPMGEASIILNWHRRVTGSFADDETAGGSSSWQGAPRVANLNLRLFHTDDAGDEHELAVSKSRVDNVEHIYLSGLDAGRYRLEVSRIDRVHDEPWDYALAWRVELLDEPTESDDLP